MIKLIAAALVLGMASVACADILASDDFDYTGLLTDNGWTAYSGADGSITANGLVASVGGGAEDIRFTTAFADQGTGDTFASFVLNVSSAGSGSYAFGFLDGTSMESRFGIIVGSTGYTLNVYGNGTSSLGATAELSLSTDYTITLAYDATTYTHSLWVNATPSDEGTPDLAYVSGSNTGIDNFFIRQTSGDSDYTMGSLVVGENFSDVVTAIPEPATMSLLGLGALAMVLRRKMKK